MQSATPNRFLQRTTKFVIMKKLTLERFLDQSKPLSHFLFILITLIGVSLILIGKGAPFSFTNFLFSFVIGLIQLEFFLLIAKLIFKKFDPNLPAKNLTGLVLGRFVVFLTICFIAALIIILVMNIILGWIRGEDASAIMRYFFEFEFNVWFRSIMGGLTFGAIIFIFVQWQEALKREQKLKEENLIFQNETLRSQVNPHFLFNSLNTVSALIVTNPVEAEMFISNLSSVYRYILDNGQKDKVLLQSELDLVNRYFDLHRVRDEGKIVLSIDYSDPDDYKILPVSLQILLENAIKHNMATREYPLKISIYIEEGYIIVKNNLQRKTSQLKSTGIGLKNLSERLRLITGKDLIIEETDEFFTVKIPLFK